MPPASQPGAVPRIGASRNRQSRALTADPAPGKDIPAAGTIMPVLQAKRTVQLAADAGSQPADLLVQRFPIALGGLAADALAGYEHVIVPRIASRSAAAQKPGHALLPEAGDVLRRFEAGDLAAPGVAGIGDAADVFGGQLGWCAHHGGCSW
jgi:hypothetical protein